MCGIAAIFAYAEAAPPVDRDELIRIRDQMASRGPDGTGEWFSDDRRVGLAHRRLSIIDLSPASDEPLFNADRSVAIVFNGEIYNYRELRNQLVDDGYPFKSQGDGEVILAMYQRRGIEATVAALRGMYAFAIWDKAKGGMLLARDPFGIKPLYYSDNGHTVRVASQVKALRAGGKVDTAPDPAGHVGFFLWGHVPDPFTFCKGVRSLPAGTTMWVGRGGARAPKNFCDITKILAEAEAEVGSRMSEAGSPVVSSSRGQVEHLRSALAETVRYHLVADVPVGVFLSSGLDSTTIAALAAEQGGNLRTVTLGFQEYKGTESDETPLAEDFARRCGANHQTIWVSRADFEAERDHLFESMDRPSIDGVNTFFVSLAAKQANLKVALSGLGGDELFATYPSFRDVPRTMRLVRALPFSSTFGGEFRALSAPVLKRFTSPKYAGLFEYGGSFAGAYLLRRGLFMPWELPELLDPEIVREGWAELQTLVRLDETLDGISNTRLKVSALELQWYMRHQLLRDSDWAGMGHSVEIRVPFVDVQFLKQLGPLLASSSAPSKRDMAAASSKLMTPEILDRRKTGFQIPVREWLLTDHPGHAIDSPYRIPDRGLRGWAKYVYRRFGGTLLRQKRPIQPARSLAPAKELPPAKEDLTSQPERIVVFRIGQLGDTLVSVPAMWTVRKSFPNAHIALLCDRHPGKSHVVASSLLRGSNLFDEYLSYPVAEGIDFWRKTQMTKVLATIRAKRFDTLVYLAPTGRKPDQIARDRAFFRLAGIRNFIGMRGFRVLEAKEPGRRLRELPRESDLLLMRLAVSGLAVQEDDARLMDLGLGEAEESAVQNWLGHLSDDAGRVWIAVGPRSKMPAKRWPLRRFEELIRRLIAEFDVWPVVFGGEEDQVFGDWLIGERWGRGYNAAGVLGVRPSLAAMKRCQMFVGNDTGTMHMAAAVGVPCVAIFSSRVHPGLWYPAGPNNRIFRTTIECEGCQLMECVERNNSCINAISVDAVKLACSEVLGVLPAKREPAKPDSNLQEVASNQ